MDEAGPSVPVEVLGLNGTPEAGDVLNVVETEAQAREIADYRHQAAKDKRAAAGAATTLEQLMAKAKADENVSELPVVVKAPTCRVPPKPSCKRWKRSATTRSASASCITASVRSPNPMWVWPKPRARRSSASTSVRTPRACNSANQKGVEIRYYSIIYDLVDDIKAAASGLLSNEVRENFIGYAQIREVFKVTGVGKVAGYTWSPKAWRVVRPASACCATTW